MSTITLRPYQEKAHEASFEAFDKGITKQLIVLFTGGGKTKLTVSLLDKYKENHGLKRVLWLSFEEELTTQSAMAFIRDKFDESLSNHIEEVGFLNYMRNGGGLFGLSDFKLGCLKADIWQPEGNVVMGSVMSLHRKIEQFPPDYWDVVVCDEAHKYGSASANKVLSYLQPKLLLGLTATPHRESGVPLSDIFQEIIFDYALDKGIKDGWSAEMDAIRIKTTTSLDSVRTVGGELNQGDLANHVNNLARNQQIVDSYRKYADGRKCIAFCVDIQHSIDLAETFKNSGYTCEAISSDEERTPNRKGKLKAFKENKIQILTNTGILVTGYDEPETGCVIMACPTKSLTKFLQAVGRGARLKPQHYVDRFGQNCKVIDVVDVTTRHSLVNTWELDRKKPIEERTFVTHENKIKLLEERNKPKAVITHTREEDEIVNLLRLPKIDLDKYGSQHKPASEKQLAWIQKFGYNIVDETYTMEQVTQILNSQQIQHWEMKKLKERGYDVSQGCTVAQYAVLKRQFEKQDQKQLISKYTPNNNGNPFF